jgi:hypothetical protein
MYTFRLSLSKMDGEMKINLESFPKQIEDYFLDIPCEQKEQEYVFVELADRISQLYVKYLKPESHQALHSEKHFSEYPQKFPSDEETVKFSANLKAQIFSSLHEQKRILLTTYNVPQGILIDAMKQAGITHDKYNKSMFCYLPDISRISISAHKQIIHFHMWKGR